MKLETILLFAIILASLLVGIELASEASDCSDRGGVMVKTLGGWYDCIGGRR